MATNTVCKSCLRSLTRQRGHHLRPSTTAALRNLTTSTRLNNPVVPSSPPPPPPNPSAPPPPPKDSTLSNLAASLRKAAPRSTTEPYIAYGGTEDLFAECARQADYTIPQVLLNPPEPPPQNAAGDHLGVGTGWWLTPKSAGGLGLDPTFYTWAQVCMLHMYMLTVRLRAFPPDVVGAWHQNLLDHFFYAAEDKMATWHGMSSRSMRNKALKDIFMLWRGVQLGYDEGLVKGDAVFATALWRNVFKGLDTVDLRDLVRVSGFVRKEMFNLGRMEDDVIYEGRVSFGSPEDVDIGGQAKRLAKPFGPEDLQALKEV